jgi:hypothetical protein
MRMAFAALYKPTCCYVFLFLAVSWHRRIDQRLFQGYLDSLQEVANPGSSIINHSPNFAAL